MNAIAACPPHLSLLRPLARRLPAWLLECLAFTVKEARACLFAGLFFAAVLLLPRGGLFGIPRYDLLLLWALAVQAAMLALRLESRDELRAIGLFHLLGFALEVFKTSPGIGSWSYPDPAFSKLFGVPLFSGFMYAAVGSYIIQAWRLFDLRVERHPPYWMATGIATLLYLNFFTHHFIGDWRHLLAAFALGLYARTRVVFRPLHADRHMPLPLALVLIAFFIWLAENAGTLFGLWSYPHQIGAWSSVHVTKWGAWSLLVLMSFTLIVQLKRIRDTVSVR